MPFNSFTQPKLFKPKEDYSHEASSFFKTVPIVDTKVRPAEHAASNYIVHAHRHVHSICCKVPHYLGLGVVACLLLGQLVRASLVNHVSHSATIHSDIGTGDAQSESVGIPPLGEYQDYSYGTGVL